MSSVSSLFNKQRLSIIAGPCVIESEELCLRVAQSVKTTCEQYGLPLIFKASFDKANRTSVASFRGPGLERGLQVLEAVRQATGLPLLTDVHSPEQVAPVAQVVDVLQIPAFLCRQTDLIVAAAQCGKPINVKKGQFLAPEDVRHIHNKFVEAGGQAEHLAFTERGSSFGYANLVVDMRGLQQMRQVSSAAIIFDATHSVQRPSGDNGITGGDRTMAPVLARAASAVGVDGIFCEVHEDPDQAKSDAANSLTYELFAGLCRQVSLIDNARRQALDLDNSAAGADKQGTIHGQ